MLRYFFTLFGIMFISVAHSQTTETIDSLWKCIQGNLAQYDRLTYNDDETLNEDAHQYDTAFFYQTQNKELVYMKWLSRSHTYHISGDVVSTTELVFSNGKPVLKRISGYSFVNPQWHLEKDLDQTEVSVFESLREYYRNDGTALIEYEPRSAEGIYKQRFEILDSIALEPKLQRRWSNRCDECIETDYLVIYRKLLTEKGP